ncbi:5527_t:CDS:2 [Funneliformis mosseae]|uniref:5527_t:CDS:1 n=1 Tax=Funneliformis mosseae TaxID=27381 RepID=A0A9N9I045_FUNMO|nr:5527_t:CDS:2 [Funneliformis mosseae]
MSTSHNPQDSNGYTVTSSETISTSPSAPPNNINDQPLQPTQNTTQEPECNRLCSSSNNLFEFYFQHPNDQRINKVACEMISHSNIVQYLNLNIYGLRRSELQQQSPLNFSNRHKEILIQNGDVQPQQGESSFNSGQN